MTAVLIREIRARLRLTQEELAERLRVSPVTVSRWERGTSKPMPMLEHQLERMAAGLVGVASAKEA